MCTLWEPGSGAPSSNINICGGTAAPGVCALDSCRLTNSCVKLQGSSDSDSNSDDAVALRGHDFDRPRKPLQPPPTSMIVCERTQTGRWEAAGFDGQKYSQKQRSGYGSCAKPHAKGSRTVPVPCPGADRLAIRGTTVSSLHPARWAPITPTNQRHTVHHTAFVHDA